MLRPRRTPFTRLVTAAYRRRWLPARGYGWLFGHTPQALWGGPDVTASTPFGDLALRLRDPGAQYLLTFGTVADEDGEIAFMRRLLPRVQVMFDVGANYGFYARMARELAFEPVVVAIEANPNLLPYLRHNGGSGVHVIHAAVSDELGEIVMHVSANSTMSSASRAVGRPVTVPAITIDETCARVGATPDVIKCDVEGGELAALRGAAQVRSGENPPVWLIEVYEPYLLDVGGSLAALHDEFTRFGPVSYYCATSTGDLIGLKDLEDLRVMDHLNVVVVPEQRSALIGGLHQGAIEQRAALA